MAIVHRFIRRNDDSSETWFCVGAKSDIYDQLDELSNLTTIPTIEVKLVDAEQLPPMEQYPTTADRLFAMFEAATFDAEVFDE